MTARPLAALTLAPNAPGDERATTTSAAYECVRAGDDQRAARDARGRSRSRPARSSAVGEEAPRQQREEHADADRAEHDAGLAERQPVVRRAARARAPAARRRARRSSPARASPRRGSPSDSACAHLLRLADLVRVGALVRPGPPTSSTAGRPCSRGLPRKTPSSSPSRPSPMFACRSRFEPSGAAESLTCSARRRSSPIDAVDLVEQRVERRRVGDVDAGDVEVARVEADAEPRVPVEPLVERRELLDRAADRAAGAGRVLHQEPRRRRSRARAPAPSRAATRSSPRSKPGAEMRADVEDDAVGADRARDLHRVAQRRDRLLVDVVVRRREVAEVERVAEHAVRARPPRAARGSGRRSPGRGSSAARRAGSA